MTISMSLVFLEILLVIPFTNAKVEYLSSTMTCVKKDWQNRLSQDKVDAVLRVKEEGPSFVEFDPEEFINLQLDGKV